MALSYRVSHGGCLNGKLRVPGDKSISHRALLFGAVAEGETRVRGLLHSGDTHATRVALSNMGVIVTGKQDTLRIQGVGIDGLQAPAGQVLDVGNSGTSMRLLTGLLAGQKFASTLSGDDSLLTRPMERISEPLKRMGAAVSVSSSGTAPICIEPVEGLSAIRYKLPVASAQIKSCLLLAGLYAKGDTCVIEPQLSRDHTERLLAVFGYPVRRHDDAICITGGGKLIGTEVSVPADISSAAFFLVGAAISKGSDLTAEQVSVNPTRAGCVTILDRMGARIEVFNHRLLSGEPVADIRVRGSDLHGVDITPDLVASAIDEFPVLFVAAACASGTTRVRGVGELKHKESDRIGAMVEGLTRLGIHAAASRDGVTIEGGAFTGGVVNSFGDHRVAMAFAIAALGASAPIEVVDCANVATSFPNFVNLAASAGLVIEQISAGTGR